MRLPLPALAILAATLALLTACTGGVPGERPAPAEPDPLPDSDRVCTQQYEPVCARRDGDMRTFGNACEAGAAGYRTVHDGRCEDKR
ncbi:hypothetical protein [Notoacmeibacter ruber]|uniref:hypothetical protein n=1 Tax=Notoacmeibacter ruber TaxID=2670375 RepID=UPI0018F3018D